MTTLAKRLAWYISTRLWFVVDARIYGIPIHISPPHIWWHLLLRPGERWMADLDGAKYGGRWRLRVLGLSIGARN